MPRAIFLLMLMLTCAAAQMPLEPARALARRVAGLLGPADGVQVSVRNLARIPEADFAAVRQAIEAQLKRPEISGEPVRITITLAEGANGYLWAAELVRAGRREAVVIGRAGPRDAGSTPAPSLVSLSKTLVWEHDEPILDAAAFGNETAILTTSTLVFAGAAPGSAPRSIPIPKVPQLPRDPRGRLVAEGDSLTLFLPGLVCVSRAGAEPAPDCRPAAGAWPGMPDRAAPEPGRNYFSVENMPPFFSAAAVGDRWVLAGTDGSARLYDNTLKFVATLGSWGSEVAAVDSACGAFVLATRADTADERDSVQAFDISGVQAVPASEALEFPGRVVALSGSFAVIRNLETGRYAAFRLAISCGR